MAACRHEPHPTSRPGLPPSWARRPDAEKALHRAHTRLYGECVPLTAVRCWRRKFIWFTDKPRPPYHGSHSVQAVACGPRVFGRREPSLEYEVESDEEWCEEPEGENLEVCFGGCEVVVRVVRWL